MLMIIVAYGSVSPYLPPISIDSSLTEAPNFRRCFFLHPLKFCAPGLLGNAVRIFGLSLALILNQNEFKLNLEFQHNQTGTDNSELSDSSKGESCSLLTCITPPTPLTTHMQTSRRRTVNLNLPVLHLATCAHDGRNV